MLCNELIKRKRQEGQHTCANKQSKRSLTRCEIINMS